MEAKNSVVTSLQMKQNLKTGQYLGSHVARGTLRFHDGPARYPFVLPFRLECVQEKLVGLAGLANSPVQHYLRTRLANEWLRELMSDKRRPGVLVCNHYKVLVD